MLKHIWTADKDASSSFSFLFNGCCQHDSCNIQTLILDGISSPYFENQNKNHTPFWTSDRLLTVPSSLQSKHFLKQTGLPFLSKNSNLQNIDKLINDYPEKPSKFIYNQSYRCLKGVIIAKLIQNPYFDTLTKAYEFILEQQSQGKDMMPKYLKLLEHLKLWSVN